MTETQFFDEMWLNLDKELSSYDNFIKDTDWMSSSTPSNQVDNSYDSNREMNTPNLSVQTYEDLINHNTEDPSKAELRSKSRAERIEAIKQLYNQMPTIIDASSIAKLHKTANRLYKMGQVKKANELVKSADNSFKEDFMYLEEDDSGTKSFQLTKNADGLNVMVQISDKEGKNSITKSFDNALDAVKFYLHPEEQ